MKNIFRSFNPYIFFIIALYVGEANLGKIGIPIMLSSSVMYTLVVVGILTSFKTLTLPRELNGVFVLYIYIIIRNINFDLSKEVFLEYLLPNSVTLLLFFILIGYLDKFDGYDFFVKVTYLFLSVLIGIGSGKALFTNERLYVFGGPNGFYKFALLFESISFVQYMVTKRKKYIFFSLTGVILALMTGSKGAIISLCIVIPIEYCYYCANNKKSISAFLKKILVLLFIVLGIGIGFWVAYYYLPSVRSLILREIAVFSSDSASLTSVSSRIDLWKLSWRLFLESPFCGKGAMYIKVFTRNSIQPQPYSHNIFLELLCEQGIVGFGIFIYILIRLCTKISKKMLMDKNFFIFIMGFMVYFIGAQFSGNILDSKVFLFFAALIISYNKKESECIIDY